ncbi:amidohydrolase family protein [Leptobacterium sp. I13]|uniref:amidohydrolase family protein n=1 Tax=Leptobacterium meishanense TaxID=3128904 RepID=UPI0030EB5A61
MKNIKYTKLAILFLFSVAIWSQQAPAPKQPAATLIIGATAHIGNGQVIENSAIGFDNGKITYVGNQNNVSQGDYKYIIDATGKHVYPGFIAANSSLGLVEIDAVRATDDDSEIGGLIPHVRSIIAYNAESKIVESMRPNGILLAQVAPRGGRISGTSSVVQLDAWNWEEAAIKTDDAIHMNWPNSFVRGRWWLGEDPGLKPNKKYTEQVDELKTFLKQAKAYLQGSRSPKNLPFEAVEGLFTGKQKLYVNADGEKEITDAVYFSESLGITNLVIVGGDEADKVAKLLAQKNIPVLLSRPHRLPGKEDDNAKQPFMLAKLLVEEGVLVSIEPSGRMERMNTRNLPFYAGSFAAYGLDKEKAVQMITGDAAKILGIDDFAGTLEVGKDATLFVSEGDALDMRTNRLSYAFIQGRKISLETHQTKLWKRYVERLSRE